MGFVDSVTDSGIVVREHGADGAAIARALKQYDPDLRLVPQRDGEGRTRWEVWQYQGGDRPAAFLLAWTTRQGEPLPLSMRLLDTVRLQDRNETRSKAPDADVENAKLRAGIAKDFDADADEIAREHAPYIDRGRVQIRVAKQVAA